MHGLAVDAKEGLLFVVDVSQENTVDSYLCFSLALLAFGVLLLFPLLITFFIFMHGF